MKSKEEKIVITTQPVNQAARLTELLIEAGVKVYNMPMIKIIYTKSDSKLNSIINSLKNFNLLVFTIRNGVIGFFQLLKSVKGNYQIQKNLKIAVIGESTAKEVRKFNSIVHYINEGITSDDFVDYLNSKVVNDNDNILLALGNLTPDKLQDNLNTIAKTERINVYETIIPGSFDEEILHLVKTQNIDLTVFTSPSTFNNFIQTTQLDSKEFSTSIACIGTTTASYIKSKGYNISLIAGNPAIESFAQEIISYLNNSN